MEKGDENLNDGRDRASEIRIDRNLGRNITVFTNFGEQNKAMVKSVVWYVANQLKNQLFNEGVIDPHDFAKVMGYELNTLTTRHPNPACFQHFSEKEKKLAYKKQEENPKEVSARVFDSWFENALYMLLNQNITFPTGAKTYTQNGDEIQEITLESYRIFTRLTITFRHSKRGKAKILYEYTLDENFRNNLSLYYMNINLNQANLLRKKNLDDLYITVKNLREAAIYNQKLECESDLNFLCNLANINTESFSEKKKRLNKAFKTLSSVLDFKVELKWRRGSQASWPNVPIICFGNFSDVITTNDAKTEKIDILYQNFISGVSAQIRQKMGIFYYNDCDNKQKMILEYIKDRSQCSHIELENLYKNAQVLTFKEYSEKSKIMYARLYDLLPRMNNIEDIKLFFANPFSSSPSSKDELERVYKTVIEINISESANVEELMKKGFRLHTIKNKCYKCK